MSREVLLAPSDARRGSQDGFALLCFGGSHQDARATYCVSSAKIRELESMRKQALLAVGGNAVAMVTTFNDSMVESFAQAEKDREREI